MSIAGNIKRINDSIAESCLRAGRNPAEVRLMGVSKFFPRSAAEEARKAGLSLFGESRVQEAEEKFAGLCGADTGVELHLIGSLQRNKAKKAAGLFDCIQSIDRAEIIETLGALTAAREKPLMVLLELNSGEAQKGGYRSEEELFGAVKQLERHKGLELRGLMTVAPLDGSGKIVREAFRRLAQSRQKLAAVYPQHDFSTLSMGMSGDYQIAIEEGATLIRIGTAIFGARV